MAGHSLRQPEEKSVYPHMSPDLYGKAVAESLQERRERCSVSTDILQSTAIQNVRAAYEYTTRYYRQNKAAARDLLVQIFTLQGVSAETAGRIVDTDIVRAQHV